MAKAPQGKGSFEFDHLINFRDLGGHPCAGGGRTRVGVLFRCGMPRNPSARDMAKLRELGVRTVIDLRGDLEARERPSSLARDGSVDYSQISLLEINPATAPAAVPLLDIYKRSLEEYSANYAAAFTKLANARLPAVFHCFLGKDRTGILAAMLLSLAGVGREDIVRDYSLSEEALRPFILGEIERNTGLIWENNDEHLGSPPSNMAGLLDELDSRWGGVENYLLRAGVSARNIDKAAALLCGR